LGESGPPKRVLFVCYANVRHSAVTDATSRAQAENRRSLSRATSAAVVPLAGGRGSERVQPPKGSVPTSEGIGHGDYIRGHQAWRLAGTMLGQVDLMLRVSFGQVEALCRYLGDPSGERRVLSGAPRAYSARQTLTRDP
jgi:hypothetical protein